MATGGNELGNTCNPEQVTGLNLLPGFFVGKSEAFGVNETVILGNGHRGSFNLEFFHKGLHQKIDLPGIFKI